MSLFDLLFVALVLAGAASLLVAAVAALLGRRASAVRLVRRVAVVSAAYAVTVVLVSALVPRRAVRVGEPLCFDDWCLTVLGAHREAAPGGAVVVELRLENRARGVTQREVGLLLSVTDAAGRSFDPVPDASDIPLDTRLEPGRSVAVTRRFALPADAQATGLVVEHGGFPIRWFLLGEGPFRKPPIVRLGPDTG